MTKLLERTVSTQPAETDFPSFSSDWLEASENSLSLLSYSPLRYFDMADELRAELSSDHARVLSKIAHRLQEALPVDGMLLRRTADGELLLLAVLGQKPTSDEAFHVIEELEHWLDQQNAPESILVDIRRV